jgi:hypothetical protein
MAVTVEHGSMRIDSSSEDAAAVSSSLAELDKAAPLEPVTAPAPVTDADPGDEASPAEAAPDEPETPAEERNADGTFKAKSPKKDSPEKRIAKVVYEREQARQEAVREREQREALAAELEALRKGQSPAAASVVPAGEKPTLKVFTESGRYETYEDAVEAYQEARDDWKEAQWRQKAEAQQAEETSQARQKAWMERQTAFTATTPDYQEVVGANSLWISDAMIGAILESEHGPAVLYFLATHPEEATQLAAESKDHPPSTVPVMRRLLESKVASPAPAAPTGPAKAASRSPVPAPISPVGAGPVVSETPPDQLPFGRKYVEAQNRRDEQRMRAKYGR